MNRPVQVVNGGLYLRGLLEEGERKSLEPMVARVGAAVEYESVQQFLADSPWDPALVVAGVRRAGVPEIERRGVGARRHRVPQGRQATRRGSSASTRGRWARSATARSAVSVHAVGERGTVPLGWPLYLPEDWCADAERRREGEDPRGGRVSRPSRSSGSSWSSARPAGRSRARRCSATRPTATTPSCATRLHDGRHRVRALGRRRRATVFAPETVFARPAASGPAPRGRRAGRAPTASPSRSASSSPTAGPRAAADASPSATAPTASRSPRASRSCACIAAHPRRRRDRQPAARGVADRRVARGPRRADRLLALQPARRHRARAPRPAGPAALDDRARLPPAQGRARPRPLRGPQLARLAPPLRAGHRRPRLPDPGTADPNQPRGRPDTAPGGAAAAARLPVLDRPLPHLPPARRPHPSAAPPPTHDE